MTELLTARYLKRYW